MHSHTKFISFLFALCFPTALFASSQTQSIVGLEIGKMTYREPGLMRDHGLLYGVHGGWSYRDGFVFIGEAVFTTGLVDYDSRSTGNSNDIRDNIFEIRALIGHEWLLHDEEILTPYIGVGYRYLFNQAFDDGEPTTTGAIGYDRDANYFYTPIGIEIANIPLDHKHRWHMGGRLEFDHFWYGIQRSHFEVLGFDTLINEQRKGYGFRGSVWFDHAILKDKTARIEPYFRLWEIKRSDLDTACLLDSDCQDHFTGIEPHNRTRELGVRFSVVMD